MAGRKSVCRARGVLRTELYITGGTDVWGHTEKGWVGASIWNPSQKNATVSILFPHRDPEVTAQIQSTSFTLPSFLSLFFLWLFWVFVVCRLSLVAASWVTLVSVPGLLGEVVSRVAEHRPRCPEARGILVPWPGIELMSPALAGGFSTTRPPGKSCLYFLIRGRSGSTSSARVGFLLLLPTTLRIKATPSQLGDSLIGRRRTFKAMERHSSPQGAQMTDSVLAAFPF